MAKVFVYSIPRDTATRISDWVNDNSGRRLKKTKVGRARDTVQALYSPSKGGLLNGLSYKPWMENGKQVTDEEGNKLTLQHKLEQKWGLDKGFLTNRPWRKGDSQKEEDMPYYQKKAWKLNDGCTVLDTDKMDDELFYYVLIDSHICANSEKEWREHRWPKAQFYIALENEEDEIKFKRNEAKSKAFAALHNESMTPTVRKQMAAILELTSTQATLTDEQSHNVLFSYIDKTDFRPGNNIDKFTELYKLLETPVGREELEARYLLKKLLDYRVIYEKQGSYEWIRPSGKITLGNTYSEAVEFLLNPKKQTHVEELEEQLALKAN